MRLLNSVAAGSIAVGLLLAVAACGGGDPDASTAPTPSDPTSSNTQTTEPTPTDSTPTEPTTDEDEAAAALLGYLEVRDEAYATGRIGEKLNKFATGREHFALQQFVTSLNQAPKTHFEGEWIHKVVETRQPNADVILVTDCQDANEVSLIRDADGQVLPWFKDESGDEIPRRLQQIYRVVPDGETWKVESGASNPNRPETC